MYTNWMSSPALFARYFYNEYIVFAKPTSIDYFSKLSYLDIMLYNMYRDDNIICHKIQTFSCYEL